MADIDITKSEFYERHWIDNKSMRSIVSELDAGRRKLREWCNERGVIRLKHGETPQQVVFTMRPKRYYYELYWEQGLTIKEIAQQHDVHHQSVRRAFDRAGVPMHPPGGNGMAHWDGDIPRKYQWPDGRNRVSRETELPDVDDPSKYLAETPPERDKDTLYDLYWGHGHTITAVAARLDADTSTLRHNFEQLGIPKRDYHEHKRWEPHHDRVPPKYEWPDGVPPSELEAPTTDPMDDFEQGIWRTPSQGPDGVGD